MSSQGENDKTKRDASVMGQTYILSSANEPVIESEPVQQVCERDVPVLEPTNILEYYTWKKGMVLIINHENFKYLPSRDGTHFDKRDLDRIFQKYGFSTQVLQDKTKKEIMNELTKVAKSNAYDCVFVIVLTHGEEGDLLHAADVPYYSKELWECFRKSQCSSLITKPKIFLIQACRGEEPSMKVRSKVQTDSRSYNSPQRTFPTEADILVAHSTHEGKVAHRNTDEGSWFIQALFNEILVNGDKDDLVTMLTRVNRRVAIMEHGESKQMPVIQSTLTRKLFLSGSDPAEENKHILSGISEVKASLETKFGDIVDMVMKKANTASKPSARWKELGHYSETGNIDLPDERVILELSKELKKYMEMKEASRENVGNVTLLLNYISLWQVMDIRQRQFAYSKLTQLMKTLGLKSKLSGSKSEIDGSVYSKSDPKIKTIVQKKVINKK